jgi:hypothetical protein
MEPTIQIGPIPGGGNMVIFDHEPPVKLTISPQYTPAIWAFFVRALTQKVKAAMNIQVSKFSHLRVWRT